MASKVGAELNDRQRAFVDEYVKDWCGKAAAIRAGYTERSAETTASKLLRNPKVQAYLQQRAGKVSQVALVDAAYVLRSWKKLIDTGLVLIPKRDFAGDQVTDADGSPVFKCVDPGSANTALANLAKHLRMFEQAEAEAEEAEQSSGVLRVPAPVSPDEWEKK